MDMAVPPDRLQVKVTGIQTIVQMLRWQSNRLWNVPS